MNARKPADGTASVEAVANLKEELEMKIADIGDIIASYEALNGYFNLTFRDELFKALEHAEIAYNAILDDLDAMEE